MRNREIQIITFKTTMEIPPLPLKIRSCYRTRVHIAKYFRGRR